MLIWVVYFWVVAVATVLSALGRLYLYFTRGGVVTAYDLVESILALSALGGLYGFAYQSPVGTPAVWKAMFALLVAAWLWNLAAPKSQVIVDKFGAGKGGAALAALLMLAVPEIVGLYLYGFRSQALWK